MKRAPNKKLPSIKAAIGKLGPKRPSPLSPANACHTSTPNLTLTPEQDKALVAISSWLKEPLTQENWMFTLSGFAGTGKTSTLQYLVQTIDQQFLCCAPTGKAASVLRGKIPGLDVRTAHQILYVPTGQSVAALERLERALQDAKANDQPTVALLLAIRDEKERLSADKVSFMPKPSPDVIPGRLIIVDESSMVSERMRDDFKDLDCKVLFVGDSGQLPPVRETSWFIEHKHDATLTTIMRQALDSPIIRLSMQVREGRFNREEFASGNCMVISKGDLDPQLWLKADQILTGGNASRRRINRYVRKCLGYNRSSLPVAGEKMICLKNDHYKIPPWINGIQFTTTEDTPNPSDAGQFLLNCDYDGIMMCQEFYPYHCNSHYVEDLEEEPREMRKGLFEADYAYGITVHKSQGSEWPFVIVADDKLFKEQVEFRKRWLYTAITRAKQQLIIAQ